MADWIEVEAQKPPENQIVQTKIDDEKGVRNEAKLIYSNGLWWLSDKSMYVYYTPTHWRALNEMTAQEVMEIRSAFRQGKTVDIDLKAIGKCIDNALQKQTPKKPDIYGDGYGDDGNLIYDTYDCPNCQTSYEIEYEKYDYCPHCGQAIDWGENNG